MKREPLETADNSKTLLIPEWNETYHSQHGALTEAMHVFIQNGLVYQDKSAIKIFEMGFGTGLNALLTLDHSVKNNLLTTYHSVEKFPLSYEEVEPLSYPERTDLHHRSEQFKQMHLNQWEEEIEITNSFHLKKMEGDIQKLDLEPEFYDLIYYDAFGPRVQPDLWNERVCQKLFDTLRSGGILVTYCAQGQFKRNLKTAGFEVEGLPGPPGKREMTRAKKN